MLVYFPAVGHVCFMRAEGKQPSTVHGKINILDTGACVSVCVCRSGLHHPDAARQPQLVHQPVDLHGVLQQRVQGAAEPAAVRLAAGPPGLAAGRLHHHAQLHHQGQPVLTARPPQLGRLDVVHIPPSPHLRQMFPATKDGRARQTGLGLS